MDIIKVRCFVVTGRIVLACVYRRVAEGGGRGAASGLWLEGRLCSKLTVMQAGDLVIAGGVSFKPGSKDPDPPMLSDRDSALGPLCIRLNAWPTDA